MDEVEQFLTIFRGALLAIREPRFFETERGYQGELVGELKNRLKGVAYPGDPIIEQEYQKTLPDHGLKIRPDIILHVPFGRGTTATRKDGNFVAIEIKRRATPREAGEDFGSLEAIHTELRYPLMIFLNIDSAETHADRCPKAIANRTVSFAALLKNGEPHLQMQRCG